MSIQAQIETVREALRKVANRPLSELVAMPETFFDSEGRRIYWISGEIIWSADLAGDHVDLESTRPAGHSEDPFQSGWEHQIAGMLWQANGHPARAFACEGAARWIFMLCPA